MGLCECRRRTAGRGNGSGAGVRKLTHVDTRLRPPTIPGERLTPRLCVNGLSKSSTVDLRWSPYGTRQSWPRKTRRTGDPSPSEGQSTWRPRTSKTLRVRRRSLSRRRTGEPSMLSCPGPQLICEIRSSSLPSALCIQMLNDRPCARRWRTFHLHRRAV
jgi:hypothetical protein